MSNQLTIAISGINATDNPGPGIPVAKSLKESELDVYVIGLSYDASDPGNYMDFFIDKSYIIPFPTKGWSGIKKRLLEIKSSVGLDIIIPCLDAELPLYIKYQDELRAEGIDLLLPTEEQFNLRNKDRLGDLVEELSGCDYPKTTAVTSIAGLERAVMDLELPVMIKGNYYKAYIARSYPEAVLRYTEIAEEWGYPVLVQKIVTGEELNLVGLGDGKGNILGAVAIKKSTTTSIGKIWTGISIQNEELMKVATKFVKKTNWRGPFELEVIVGTDVIHIIEINPRYPAWVYFATGVGVNLPSMQVKMLRGIKLNKSSEYAPGKLFVRYTDEIVVDVSEYGALATSGESIEKEKV